MNRTICIVCESEKLNNILSLGMHPFADTFISTDKLYQPDMLYDLSCDMCEKCGNIQLKTITNPADRYQANEYSYTSSNSEYSKNYWKTYAEYVKKYIKNTQVRSIIEIGSNDGYLLKILQDEGYKCLGVDASPAMAKIAQSNGVKTKIAIFNSDVANELKDEHGNADLIIANNVVNHSDNIINFFSGVSKLLSKEGMFIFEQPYWLSALEQRRFDQIYHEHVSYLTLRSAKQITRRSGLAIIDAQISEYHGGSLRIVCKKGADVKSNDRLLQIERAESMYQLFDRNTYDNFTKEIHTKKYKTLNKILNYKLKGNDIVAVGAAAKGNTILNFYGLDATIVKCVTDSSEYKIGKFTPGTRIEITKDEIIKYIDQPTVLILSWNISSILKQKLKLLNNKVKFISI